MANNIANSQSHLSQEVQNIPTTCSGSVQRCVKLVLRNVKTIHIWNTAVNALKLAGHALKHVYIL
jgi:hypothetical protein